MSRRPLLPWTDALDQVLEHTAPLSPIRADTTAALHGQVLADSVAAHWDLPAADVSMMDGYAARTLDLQTPSPRLRRVDESAAGHPMLRALGPGQTARISTGAVLPEGADIVVPQEDVTVDGDQVVIDLPAFGDVRPHRWVRVRGCDVRAGQEVLPAGLRLQPGELAMAASTGNATVSVHRRPRVAIVSTGDELVRRGQTPRPGQVISSNDLMLHAAVSHAGGVAIDHGIAPDDPAGLEQVLRGALEADVVLTSGGISVGDHDLVAATFERLGVRFQFHGVALRPGKPTAFGHRGSTVVFGLPGNPASAWVTFSLFCAPALRRLLGVRDDVRPWSRPITLRNEARGAGRRTHFLRARLHADDTATVLSTQTSGNLRSLCGVDALVEVPAGIAVLESGSVAAAYPTNPWWIPSRSS